MATEQLLLRLPQDLVRRFKQSVPARERNAFVRQLLEQALPAADGDNDPLYLAALAVEQDTALNEEMGEWEAATIGDGLDGHACAGAARLNGAGRWPRLLRLLSAGRSGG